MDKNDTGIEGISDADLTRLLASMKVAPAPEADFEERFLYDLRERLARESVCCSARRLLWDHIVQFLTNFGSRKLAYSASTLGLGALAVGFFALPGEETTSGSAVAKSPLSRLERSLAALRPNSGHDVDACTTITICEQKKTPYTDASLASGGISSFYASSASASAEVMPVNMGLTPYVADGFPSYSTASGF